MKSCMITPLSSTQRPIIRINGRLLTSKPLNSKEAINVPSKHFSVLYVPILALTPTFLISSVWKKWAIRGIDGILWLCQVAEVLLSASLVVIGGLIVFRLVFRQTSKEELK